MRLGTDVVSSIQDLYEYVMDIVKSLNRKRITDDYWKWDDYSPDTYYTRRHDWLGYWGGTFRRLRPWAGTQRMVRRNLRVHRRTVFSVLRQELGLPRAVLSPIRD